MAQRRGSKQRIRKGLGEGWVGSENRKKMLICWFETAVPQASQERRGLI